MENRHSNWWTVSLPVFACHVLPALQERHYYLQEASCRLAPRPKSQFLWSHSFFMFSVKSEWQLEVVRSSSPSRSPYFIPVDFGFVVLSNILLIGSLPYWPNRSRWIGHAWNYPDILYASMTNVKRHYLPHTTWWTYWKKGCLNNFLEFKVNLFVGLYWQAYSYKTRHIHFVSYISITNFWNYSIFSFFWQYNICLLSYS